MLAKRFEDYPKRQTAPWEFIQQGLFIATFSGDHKGGQWGEKRVYTLIFDAIFDVGAQLSHASNKPWPIFDNLCVSEYVVYETGKGEVGLCLHHADRPHERSVLGTLDETKDMLHATRKKRCTSYLNLGFAPR